MKAKNSTAKSCCWRLKYTFSRGRPGWANHIVNKYKVMSVVQTLPAKKYTPYIVLKN